MSTGCHKKIKYDVPGIEKIVSELLDKCGLEGDFSGIVNEATKSSEYSPPISVVKHSDTAVMVCVKPGDNRSRRKIWIYKPANLAIQEFFDLLKNNC
ncbi:MAG: hypothetical protein ACOYS2_03595 [Patescibacteria group bacterium]